MNDIDRIVSELDAIERERLTSEAPEMMAQMTPEWWAGHWGAKAKEKSAYVNIDLGSSGAWMVEKSTGNVFGIKAYGAPDRRKYYGRIENIDTALLARCRFTRPTHRVAIAKDVPGPKGMAERKAVAV